MVRFGLLLFVLAPLEAAASAVCDDLWLSRNTLFDKAGQCFQTPLGRSVFDNADCRTNNAVLPPQDADLLSRLTAQEDTFQCKIDTRRNTVDLPLLEDRLALEDVAIARARRARCGGYRGVAIPLRSGASLRAEALKTIEPGVSVIFGHASPFPGWDFVTITDPSEQPVGLGWIESRSDWALSCTELSS